MRNAEAVIAGPVREVFLKHNMDQNFGVSLLHRHFPLNSGQRLVEHLGVSTAWESDESADRLHSGEKLEIIPTSFKFEGDTLVPFDYSAVVKADDVSEIFEVSPEFSHDFHRTLTEYGLLDVLGLFKLEQNNPDTVFEVTEGEKNINLRRDPGGKSYEAAWGFDKDGKVVVVVRGCCNDRNSGSASHSVC